MKKRSALRRAGAALMAMAMALSLMATAAFAEGFDNTIKISGAIPNATYRVYTVLKLMDGYPNAEGVFRYEIDPEDGGMGELAAGVAKSSAYEFAGHKATGEDTGAIASKDEDGEPDGHYHRGFVVGKDFLGQDSISFVVEKYDTEGKVATGNPDAVYTAWAKTSDGIAFANGFADALRAAIEDEDSGIKPAGGKAWKAVKLGEDEVLQDGEVEIMGANDTITLTGIQKGYTLVVSDLGRYSIVQTVHDGETAEINEKNKAPSLTKKVEAFDGGPLGASNDAAVGDELTFVATIDTAAGVAVLHFEDTLPAGMDFGELSSITFYPRNAQGVASDTEIGGNREVTVGTGKAKSVELVGADSVTGPSKPVYTDANITVELKDKVLSADFSKAWLASDTYVGSKDINKDDGGLIVIKYTTVINESAYSIDMESNTASAKANVNTAKLKYSGDPDVPPQDMGDVPVTVPTSTYVYGLDITKTVLGSDTPLAGASFELRAAAVDYEIGESDTVKVPVFIRAAWNDDGKLTSGDFDLEKNGKIYDELVKEIDKEGYPALQFVQKESGEYVLAKAGDEGASATLTSGEDGKIVIYGLDANLYRLKETKAPTGFILLDAPVSVVIGGVDSGMVVPSDGKVAMQAYTDFDGDGTFDAASGISFAVANASGIRMPSTGGIGTTIFYVSGALLLACAAGAFIAVRRRKGDA